MNERELDAEFERIIAGWDAVAPDPTFEIPSADARRPTSGVESDAVSETVSEPVAEPRSEPSAEPYERPEAADTTDTPEVPGRSGSPKPTGPGGVLGFPIAPGAGHVWRGAGRPHDDDDVALEAVPSDDPDNDHFVPPTEMDLPTAEDDPMFWAIVVGLAGGPLLLLYLLFVDREGSGWWIVTALTMIGVGFILLVLRGGTERDPSDDGTRI